MGMATLTNASGADFANAFLVVRSNGSTGQMVLAQGDTDPHAAKIVGVCLNAAADNADGAVADTGDCPIQGDGTLAAGDTAYLSGTTAGRVSATPGASSVALGVVLKILSGDRVLVNLLASPGVNPALLKANNLSDVANAPIAVRNIGGLSAILSPVIDCFAIAGTTWQLVPAQIGYYFFAPLAYNIIIDSKSGTLTGAPSFKLGTDAGHTNASNPINTPTTANLNLSAVGDYTSFSVTLVHNVFKPATDFANPLVLEMVTPATGTATLSIRCAVFFTGFPFP